MEPRAGDAGDDIEGVPAAFRLAFLEPGDALAVALFSAALGWLGAYLSVSKYLLEIEPK